MTVSKDDREKVAMYLGAFVSECIRRGASEGVTVSFGGTQVFVSVAGPRLNQSLTIPLASLAESPDVQRRGQRDAERLCERAEIAEPV